MKPIMSEEISSEENSGASKDILPIFWDLASLDEAKRIDKVVDLVSTLKSQDSTDEDSAPEDLIYTIKRLVKGAGSSRKGARQGFGTALAEVMKNFVEIKFDQIYDLMEEHLSVKGSFEAQEERDALFGQVFCHAALIQAFTTDMEDCNKYAEKAIQRLLVLMKKKSYLLELCTKLIIDVFEKVNKTCFVKTIFPVMKKELKEGWTKCTPERLCILLAMERLFKDVVGPSYFEAQWSCSQVFEEKNMESIGAILKESTINAHPRVHLVWKEVLPHILGENEILKLFWNNVVEDGLMQSTHERKFLAFNVLQEMLAKVSKSQVAVIISDRLMKSVINSCNSESNYLYTAARNLLNQIAIQVSKNQNVGVALEIVHQIIRRSGTLSFDNLTKSKAVEGLIGQLDPASAANFVSWLKKMFFSGKVEEFTDGDDSSEEIASRNRKWTAFQLLVVMRNVHLKQDEALLLDVTKFLFFHGHFRCSKKKKNSKDYVVLDPPTDDSNTAICRERFLGALSELSGIHSEGVVAGKSIPTSIPGTLKSGDYFAYDLVTFAQDLLDDSKHVALVKEWDQQDKEKFGEAVQMVNEIREKVPRQAAMSEDRAFELLFLHSCLQMFDKTKEAGEVVQELVQCFRKLKEKKKRKKSNEEPHWSEVLTEILLSFLAQSSHMMRQIVNMVFTIILPHATPDSFELILEALKPKKSMSEAGLEIVNDSDGDVDDTAGPEAESDDEDDDDSNDDEDDKAMGDSTDDSDNESENGAEIDEAFRSEVKLALGDAAAVSDESEDEDESDQEDSDVDMDTVDPKVLDSMDKALAAAFKTRMMARSGKRKKQEEKKAIVHFRLRVMDIAELIVKKQPKSPFILDLIEPLLEVIKVSSMYKEERELHDRAQGILKNRICHAREVPNGEDVDKESVHCKIEDLIKLAQDASSVQMVNLITQSCMFLIRVLRGKDDIKEPSPLKTRKQRQKEVKSSEKTIVDFGSINCERLVSIFKGALDDFMTRRNSHLQPIVFMEFIKRYPAIAWKLSSSLAIYISRAVNNFRKVQACEMISQLLSRKAQGNEQDFSELSISLQQQLITVFKQSCLENFAMKAKHLHEIVKLTDKFVKENKSTFKLEINDQLALTIKDAIEGPIINRSPQLLAYCKRIVALLSEEIKVPDDAKKRKRNERGENGGKKINGADSDKTVSKADSKKNVDAKTKKRKVK